MTRQYLRQVSLIVAPEVGNALDLSAFHFKFVVKRGDNQTPNSINIRVYNLSKDTATQLQGSPNSVFTRVILQAGYQGLVPDQPYIGKIFDGSIKYVNVGHESAVDSYVDIVAADGDSAYNYAVVQVALAAGSTFNQQINACLVPMGEAQPSVGAGYIPVYPGTLPRGKTMFGYARDVLRPLAETINASWNIQDGQLQLVPYNGTLPDTAIELNSATGLIGFPQKTLSGLMVKSLLNPNIKIGAQIHIDNALVQQFNFSLNIGENVAQQSVPRTTALETGNDGFYRVLLVEHSGDTRGDEWYSNIIAVALDVSIIPSVLPRQIIVPADSIVRLPNP